MGCSPSAAPSSPSTASPSPSSATTRWRLAHHHRRFLVDVGGHAIGQRQVGDADGVADAQLGDVHLDAGRDVHRQGPHREGEELLIDQAITVVNLGGLADEDDRHLSGDHLVAPDDLKVDVDDGALDRVPLQLTGEGQEGLVCRDQRQQLVGARLPRQRHAQVTALDRDRHRVGAVAVDHAGDLALPPQAAGGA